MIGSHDSYTYLDANSDLVNNFTRFWRCQDISITDQYKAGVRYFDVRVIREKSGDNRYVWRTCHGMAELSKVFTTLKSICVYFYSILKGSVFRMFLEKGSKEDEEAFKRESQALLDQYAGAPIMQLGIKKPVWTPFYTNPNHPRFVDYTFENWTLSQIVDNLFDYPIRNHAREVNPKITQEMIDDKKVVYMLDYVKL